MNKGQKLYKVLDKKELIESLIAFTLINATLINFFTCLCYIGIYKAYVKLIFLGLIVFWLIINACRRKMTYKLLYIYWLIFIVFFILIEVINVD